MQIPEKLITNTAQAIVDYCRRESALLTDSISAMVFYDEARYQLIGIRRLLNESSKTYFFVNASIDEVDQIHKQTLDRIYTKRIALAVDAEAFPASQRDFSILPADLGRSPVSLSAGAELEEAKQGQGGIL
ncbi:MAG: hypothetical protein ACXVB0_24810 [Mucilaginibacter sp.]